MKPRKDRKFSRLRSRFPLGALVTVEKERRNDLHPFGEWVREQTIGLVIGMWKVKRAGLFKSTTTDYPGADPRSRESKNASGYLLLMSKSDVPLQRHIFEEYNMYTIRLVCVTDDVG